MMQELIEVYEEIKKYTYIINRRGKGIIVLKFQNSNFYHLIGFHKIINHDTYFPTHIKSREKRYKYMKNHIEKFNNILENQLKNKNSIKLRMETFKNIIDLLKGENTSLYNLKQNSPYSQYKGDFALTKTYENDICCLLGLGVENTNDNKSYCIANSWMASNRINRLVEFKRPIYIQSIMSVPNKDLKE